MRDELHAQRSRPALVLTACALVLAGAPAHGAAEDPAAAASGVASVQAPLQLVVNSVPHAVVTVRVTADGDVWLPVSALVAAGLHDLAGEQRVLDGAIAVSLRSLRPAVEFRVDEATLRLHVDARPELLGSADIDAYGTGRPEGLQTGGHRSVFASYAIQATDQRMVTAFGDLGVGEDDWVATSGISRGFDGSIVRGLSAVTVDTPAALRRWIAGDAVASSGPLGGTVVVGGLGVQREFALDPWFIRQPLPRTTAVALTPSVLEVYVNGRLVRTEQVSPGTVHLANLPVEAGAGTVRTVLKDAFGRTQEVEGRYYLATGLLARGVTDYAAHAGFRRDGLGTQSFDYSSPVALGRWRRGIADGLTAGLALEAGREGVSGGPTVATALPVGDVELAVAASDQGGTAGAAAHAAWSWLSRGRSVGARIATMTPSHSNVALRADQDRLLFHSAAHATLPIARSSSAGVEAELGRSRDHGRVAAAFLRGSFGLGGAATLVTAVGWTDEAQRGRGWSGNLLFTYVLGKGTTASASAQHGGASRATFGVQRSLPPGTGYGYRLDSSVGERPDATAQVEVQGSAARAEAVVRRSGGVDTAQGSIAGSIVLMAGRPFLTRPVQDGFALVQVPGVPGVRTYLNNQEVGATDRRGDVLLTGLLPYHANKVSLRAADVPIDLGLESFERLVAPPRRVGALVRFDVRPTTTFTGLVAVTRGGVAVTPAYGELRLLGGGVEPSSISSEGRFYLTGVPAGRHGAEIEYAGGVCRFAIDVPSIEAPLGELGTLHCAQDGTVAGGSAPAGVPITRREAHDAEASAAAAAATPAEHAAN